MVRNTKGFTLIELLIVVVIIGILAAIAIPKFSATREKAYISSMKADLRNLQSAQELYYSDPANAYEYAAAIGDLDDFAESSGVEVTIEENSTEGWSASATHSGTTETCDVYVGEAAPTTNATSPGVVTCSNEIP
jgi:prepilin-type N-terminal cleavage/methylation domain-containing protein